MQLNLAQFLSALQRAECTVSVSAGVVTFDNGDTFNVAAERARPDAFEVTPLAAARVLAAVPNDEEVVDAFRSITQSERNQLGAALSSFYPVLCMESKFQPELLVEPIKIPVASFEEGLAVQRALFDLGCGFHHGGYPLAKDLSDQCSLCGIFVSRKGVMTVMPLSERGSLEYLARHQNFSVSAETVLAAKSPADLRPTT